MPPIVTVAASRSCQVTQLIHASRSCQVTQLIHASRSCQVTQLIHASRSCQVAQLTHWKLLDCQQQKFQRTENCQTPALNGMRCEPKRISQYLALNHCEESACHCPAASPPPQLLPFVQLLDRQEFVEKIIAEIWQQLSLHRDILMINHLYPLSPLSLSFSVSPPPPPPPLSLCLSISPSVPDLHKDTQAMWTTQIHHATHWHWLSDPVTHQPVKSAETIAWSERHGKSNFSRTLLLLLCSKTNNIHNRNTCLDRKKSKFHIENLPQNHPEDLRHHTHGLTVLGQGQSASSPTSDLPLALPRRSGSWHWSQSGTEHQAADCGESSFCPERQKWSDFEIDHARVQRNSFTFPLPWKKKEKKEKELHSKTICRDHDFGVQLSFDHRTLSLCHRFTPVSLHPVVANLEQTSPSQSWYRAEWTISQQEQEQLRP